jgi:MFS superfamily sulfate permease-like transporter
LIVVIIGTIINEYLKTNNPEWALKPEHLVELPVANTGREFIGFLSAPDFSYLNSFTIWKIAFTLAIVASLETLLGIEAVDKLDPYKRISPTNRELKAQGVGNIVSGLLGGLPLTSVIVRSSANVNSGARTKLSTIFHGVLLLLCVIFIPRFLNLIPLSALAAILIFTGYKLVKIPLIKEFYHKGWDQFVPFMVTIVAILLTDLLIGIVIGILVGLFFLMRSNFRSSVLVVNDKNNYMVRLLKDVSFLNKPIVKRKLDEVPENAYLVIDASRAEFIDKDIIDTINEFLAHAYLKNIQVELKKNPNNPTHALFHSPDSIQQPALKK